MEVLPLCLISEITQLSVVINLMNASKIILNNTNQFEVVSVDNPTDRFIIYTSS